VNHFASNLQTKPRKKKTQFVWVIATILFTLGLTVYFTNSVIDIYDAKKQNIPKKTSRKIIKKNSKEWKDAVKRIKDSKGKGNNATVKNKETAKELILEAKPDLAEYPMYAKEPYKSGYEFHPAEPVVGNDLPHIKWKDWSNGKSDGSEGHIFYEEE